jgi:uncharacterized protein YgiM (DUF1202 family)
MSDMKRLLISTLLLGAVPLAALAETAYVTDQLRLGLHRAADTSDRAFRTLESGQEMEVLSQNRNYAQVRLPDGTVGYVKAAFIIAEKPATLVVAETRTENERLAAELERAKAQFAEPAAAIAALEQQAAKQQAALTASAARIEELEEANERYASRQAQYAYSLPLAWVAGAMILCLIGGVLAGMWWLDWRSRRRHGGIRVY